MKKPITFLVLILIIFIIVPAHGQKVPKRPTSKIGVPAVDVFVGKSFDFHEQIDSMKKAYELGQSLNPDQVEIVQLITKSGEDLVNQAGDLIDVAGKMTMFQKAKAALQVAKAVKVLKQTLADSGNLLLAINGGAQQPQEISVTEEVQSPAETTTIAFVSEKDSTGKVNGTLITLVQTNYTKFKVLTDLLEAKGEIKDKRLEGNTGTFFLAHDLSSYDLADYIISNLGESGYSIDSVSDETLQVKTSSE